MALQYFNSSDYVCQSGAKFDILKFVLAIFVVGIHTIPVPYIPFMGFFMMSSYFFFRKQSRLSSDNDRKAALWKYDKRIVLLYLFWIIVLSPYIIYSIDLYPINSYNTLKLFKSIFLSGFFGGAWFLISTILSVSLVWVLSKFISNHLLLGIGIVAYLICCLTSNYISLIDDNAISEYIYKTYSFVLGKPCTSFLVALLFVVLGKILAEKKYLIPNKYLLIAIATSITFLFVEYFIIINNSLNISPVDYSDDCYLSLVPLCLSVFMYIGQNPFIIRQGTAMMRKSSTIIYCCHLSLIGVLCDYFHLFEYGSFLFISVVCITVLFSYIICYLEKKHCLSWLKYAH